MNNQYAWFLSKALMSIAICQVTSIFVHFEQVATDTNVNISRISPQLYLSFLLLSFLSDKEIQISSSRKTSFTNQTIVPRSIRLDSFSDVYFRQLMFIVVKSLLTLHAKFLCRLLIHLNQKFEPTVTYLNVIITSLSSESI